MASEIKLASTRPHRRTEQIYYAIIKICESGALKTHIMYKANLSYYQTNNLLGLLVKQGLILIRKDGLDKKWFSTSRGLDFLKKYEQVKALLEAPEEKKLEDIEIVN